MTFGGEFKEGLKLSFAALVSNKARAILTMLGIIIGIISVTLMGAAIEGLTRAFNNSISSIGADVLYIQKWPVDGYRRRLVEIPQPKRFED